MMHNSAVFDLYVIGEPDGFYVGQAKHLKRGGWERRVSLHRNGKGSRTAHQLLLAGAPARCLGSVCTSQSYINLLEARAWDIRVAQGWKAVHRRPIEDEDWGAYNTSTSGKGRKRTPEERAHVAAAMRAKWDEPGYRERMKEVHRGRKHSPETRAKLATHLAALNRSEAHRATARGPRSAEVREKIAAGNRGIIRPGVSAKLMGHPVSLETRAKLSEYWRKKREAKQQGGK